MQARIEQDVKQGGKVLLKKGTQLGGVVTVAQSRGSQGQSQVGISFERALLPNGQSIPFHASIVALLAPQSASPNRSRRERRGGFGRRNGSNTGLGPR